MRIARVIEYFPPHIGGMERHGLILSQEQVKLGHDVEIFIGVGDISLFQKTFKAPLQFLPMYNKIRRFLFNFWAYNAVKKHHKENPYNIIHLHGDFIEAYFGSRLSKKLKIPAVLTIHAGLNKKLLKPKNAEYFKNINKIICVSNEIAEDLKSIGVPESKLEIISSGVYLDDFQNVNKNKINALRNQYSKPIIISIGVLRINKGFKYLIEAFEAVKEQLDEATLLIIGDGSDRNKLELQAKNVDGVYFLGHQNHEKIIEHLKAADIFVLASISTSSDREGTPTSIMEAMAAGLSIITTKVGGNPYLIREGENGLLVEEKNSNELARAMIKLINDENLRQKMRDKNLEDIKQKDWPLVAERITKIYQPRVGIEKLKI